MKILVLGANGQVGMCLSDKLFQTNYQTILTSRAQIDITDFEATRNNIFNINADVIINASAYTAVDNAEHDHINANLVNNLAVANIAKICSEMGSTFIHFSTDYVFDGKASKPYIESFQTNPNSIYGMTKLMGEQAIQNSNCKYLIFRTGWVFSEHGNNFFKTMLRLAKDKKDLSVVSDQVGSPTYAQDIANIVIKTLDQIEKKNCRYGLYHYSGDEPCSWYEFAKKIFDEAKDYGWSVPTISSVLTVDYPTSAHRPQYSVLDNNKIIKSFGVTPSDWKKGIVRALKELNSE
jgi:dTDP-4-dehydrorhamnose reductase